MTAVLLSAHVLAGIVLIGPITAAASVFPRYARAATVGDPAAASAAAASAAAMHRISRGYAVPAIAVPLLGIVTASLLGALTQAWVLVSMALTLVAAVLLVARIVPQQRHLLARLGGRAPAAVVDADSRRLATTTGMFALTWAVVVVLMIVRPGSTTHV